MHEWGEEDFDWEALDEACLYLSSQCRRWARFGVWTKEKWGTLRVETTCAFFGEWPLHNLVNPGYVRYTWSRWIMLYIDIPLGKVLKLIGVTHLIQKFQVAAFKFFWKKAAKKWPHIKDEILDEWEWTTNEPLPR
jgi:hypothetical protein